MPRLANRNSGQPIPGLRLTGRQSRHLLVGGGGRMGRRSGLGRNIKESCFLHVVVENKAEEEGSYFAAFLFLLWAVVDEQLVGSGWRRG